jgi:hypothetical protein
MDPLLVDEFVFAPRRSALQLNLRRAPRPARVREPKVETPKISLGTHDVVVERHHHPRLGVIGAAVAVVLVLGVGGMFALRALESGAPPVAETEVLGQTTQAKALAQSYTFTLGSAADAPTMTVVAPVSDLVSGITTPVSAKVAFNVIDVQEDRSAVIELVVRSVSSKDAIAFKAARLRLNVAPEGRVASVEGLAGIFAGQRAAVAAEDVIFTDMALEIGEKWTETLTVTVGSVTQ